MAVYLSERAESGDSYIIEITVKNSQDTVTVPSSLNATVYDSEKNVLYTSALTPTTKTAFVMKGSTTLSGLADSERYVRFVGSFVDPAYGTLTIDRTVIFEVLDDVVGLL